MASTMIANSLGNWPAHDISQLGPFVDSNDNVYFVWYSTTEIRVYKASDPNSSWSEVDSTNNPSGHTDLSLCAAAVNDTVLEIVVMEEGGGTPGPYHGQFNLSDAASNPDTWVSSGSLTNIEAPSTLSNTQTTIGIRVRPDTTTTLVCAYNGDQEKVHGTDYDRVVYAIHNGTSWSSVGNNAFGGSDQFDWELQTIGEGASNTTWMSAMSASITVGYVAVDLSSGDSLGTEEDIDPGINSVWANNVSAYYDSSGTEKIVFLWHRLPNNRQLVISGGTPQTETTADIGGSDGWSTVVAHDATNTAYILMTDRSDDRIVFRANKDEAGWLPLRTLYTEASADDINGISATIIDHGSGNVLAVAFRNETQSEVHYTEYSLVQSDPAVSAVKKRNDLVKLRR